jgi:hypothetical protein
LVAAMSVAYAANAVGVIKNIDVAKDMITLDNGSSYWANAAIKLTNFKVGEKVAENRPARPRSPPQSSFRESEF